jgi:hypothetical protein
MMAGGGAFRGAHARVNAHGVLLAFSEMAAGWV